MKLLMLHFLKKRIFPEAFLDLCKNSPNQPQFLPYEVKVVLKIMAIEQRLYAQVVMIFQKDHDNKNKKENTNKYNFQGKSTILIRLFDIDHEWL